MPSPEALNFRRGSVIGFLLILVLSATAYIGLDRGATAGWFTLLCYLPLVYLSIPLLLTKKIDPFQPVAWLMLCVALGTSFKSTVMIYDTAPVVEINLMRGQELSFFLPAAIWINVTCVCFLVGYLYKFGRTSKPSLWLSGTIENWNKKLLLLIGLAVVLLSIFSIWWFFQHPGVEPISQSNLSIKRMPLIGGKKFSYGLPRNMIALASTVFLVGMTYWLSLKEHTWKQIIPLYFLAGLCLFFPLVSSSRFNMAFTIFYLLMGYYYLRDLKLKKLLIPVAILLLMGNLWMFRSRLSIADQSLASPIELLYGMSASILHHTNGLGVSKTAFIMNDVPERVPFAYGSYVLPLLYAPIPKTTWPEKPPVLTGPVVAEKFYGYNWNESGGVPPGLTAELYWNFGKAGILIGSLLFGLLSGWVYRKFRSDLRNPNRFPLYLSFLYSVSFLMVWAGFNYAFLSLVRISLPVFLILLIINRFRIGEGLFSNKKISQNY